MDLFTQLEDMNKQVPLAELMRPKTLEEFLGQSNVVAPNSPLLNLLKTQRLFSLIFWGTPGCGKTTLARLIATQVNAQFIELSAVSSGYHGPADDGLHAHPLRYGHGGAGAGGLSALAVPGPDHYQCQRSGISYELQPPPDSAGSESADRKRDPG